MNTFFQNTKNESKINLLKEHISHLIDYNNIVDYSNVKDYSIYIRNYTENNGYVYSIEVIRDRNIYEKTLNIRLYSEERIDNLIFNLFNSLSNNNYFDYLSYINSDHFGKEFILNFKNKISIHYPIKNSSDEVLCNKISDEILSKGPNTITNVKEFIGKTKDELQEEKAKLTIRKIRNIFDNLIKLNGLESYENIKPFKLIVTNNYNNKKGCNVFNFKIIRGSNNKETITDYSFSIKKIDNVINELVNLIYNYISLDEFMYYSVNVCDNKNIYNINLKNMLQIQFNITYFKDIELFDKIFDTIESKNNNELELTNVLKLLNTNN